MQPVNGGQIVDAGSGAPESMHLIKFFVFLQIDAGGVCLCVMLSRFTVILSKRLV